MTSVGSLERRGGWRAFRHIFAIGLFGILAADSVLTAFLALVSRMNYPGGEAMVKLHAIVDSPKGDGLDFV